MPSTFQYEITGTHTGINNSASLVDSTKNFVATQRVHTGDTVYNITDGSSGVITGVIATVITAALAGGAENDWDTGDQYRIWVSERNTFSIKLRDILYFPAALEVSVADPTNAVESSYSDYQKVRLVEDRSSLVVFYGKIEDFEPYFDVSYGQVLRIQARDNLAELLKRLVNQEYSGFVRRSALVSQIVQDHVFAAANIDTTQPEFTVSTVVEAAGVLDSDFIGSGKNALRAIYELAQNDPAVASPHTTFGYDYYLDTDFGASQTPSPDLHYFPRGAEPAGGPLANGLTVQYGAAAEADQVRPMLWDYSFPRPSKELVTRVRIQYVDASGASQNIDTTLLEFDTLVGAFQDDATVSGGEIITGSTSGTTARVRKIGTTYLVISGWTGNWTINETITGTTSLATARVTRVPRQSYEQEIERVLRTYDVANLGNARGDAAEILAQLRSTVQRGEFSIARWPTFRIGGNYSLVRTGQAIHVINANAGLNQSMTVTGIDYEEGPGAAVAKIKVIGVTRGRGPSSSVIEGMKNEVETAQSQNIGATGGLPDAAQIVNLNFAFDDNGTSNQVRWPRDPITGGAFGGTPTATYSDNDPLTVSNNYSYNGAGAAANPFTVPDDTIHYFYLIQGNSTVQITNSFAQVVGIDRSLILIATRNTNAGLAAAERRTFLVSLNQGNPVVSAGTVLTNQLSAFSGNMGLLTAGAIRLPTGATNIVDVTGFTGFTLNGARIAGYNAGTLQVEIRSSDGEIYAGAGVVNIDSSGVKIIAGTAGTPYLRFENPANTVRGAFFSDASGLYVWVPDDLDFIFDLDPATGSTVRPIVSGVDLGESGFFFGDCYLNNIYTDTLNSRSGTTINLASGHDIIPVAAATSDLGTASLYFGSLYIGQAYNRITGSGGDMDFRVKNTAGNGDVLAMYITDGDAPELTINAGAILRVSIGTQLYVGVHNAIGAETVTGYVTMKDNGGTDRKFAIVS